MKEKTALFCHDVISVTIFFTFNLCEMSRTYDCVFLSKLHRNIKVTSYDRIDRCIN